jgi:hypothetical protein
MSRPGRRRAARDRPQAEACSSPCAAPRGSLESSRAARMPWTAPYRHGARRGLPVCRRRPPAKAAMPPHLRSHALVIAIEPPLFKPHAVPLLPPSPPPAAPSVPPPVNSPSHPSQVRLTFLACSLGTLEACAIAYIARHCAPSPEPQHTAAIAAGHHRALPSGASLPKLRPPTGPR